MPEKTGYERGGLRKRLYCGKTRGLEEREMSGGEGRGEGLSSGERARG